MKQCQRCHKEFDEDESVDYSPARALGDIFISDISKDDILELCPECREELGVMNTMGFRP